MSTDRVEKRKRVGNPEALIALPSTARVLPAQLISASAIIDDSSVLPAPKPIGEAL